MWIDEIDSNILHADEGMVLKQISSGIIFGEAVYLGKVTINGQRIDDFPANFEDVEPVPEPEEPEEDLDFEDLDFEDDKE